MSHPAPYALVLLVLAAWRVYRLVAVDEITARIRGWATLPDDDYEAWSDVIRDAEFDGADPWQPDGFDLDGTHYPRPWFSSRRYHVAKFARCPWCMGWWISVVVWVAWLAAGDVTLYLATPFALSAGVGLVQRNLDHDDDPPEDDDAV